MALDQQRLLAAIDEGRTNSYGTDEQSELGQRRAQAIEAYLGLNVNPAPQGRSQVVDRSVYETISVMLPSLVRIFAASSEEVCKFTPVGPEDEKEAEQTTAVVNHVVMQENQWEQIAGDWIHDAMLLCNGYAMAYWDQSDRLIREQYEDQSDDQIAALLADGKLTVVEHTQRPDEEANKQAAEAYKQAVQQYQMAVQQGAQVPPPQKPPPQFLHNVVVDRMENEGGVCIRVIPPEHCYVHVDTPNWTLQECPYFEVRQLKSIADLRAMGLEVEEDVSDDEDPRADEDDARDRFGEDRFGMDESAGVMRNVWARMIWVRCDAEGDGNSRLYYVIAVGRTILYAEPVARIPVASITPQPMPHRHHGISVAESVLDVQNVKTVIKRSGLDNLYLMQGRYAISSQVNLADFLDARPGMPVRMLQDGALPGDGHIMPLTHPFAFGEIIGSLEYFDQERQNRSGASRYFSGTDAGAINKTASGTMALQNMASMRVEHIARTMAPGVEYLFSIVHELISKHSNKPKTLKLRGQWTTVDPQAWRTKRDVRLSVGVGAGNKESMMQHLGVMFGAQMQIGPPTGLAGPAELHATVTEMAKLAGFANPAKFWKDPQKLPAPPTPPTPEEIKAKAAMQMEQFKAEQEQMRFQAEQQMEQQRLTMQAELDRNREEMQARQKLLEAQQEAELERMRMDHQSMQEQSRLQFEQWKASLDAAVKLEIADKSAKTTMDTAEMARTPDTRLDELLETIEALRTEAESLRAEAESPAEIVRDPQTGQAVAVRRGERVRKIVRGPDGRAIGVQ